MRVDESREKQRIVRVEEQGIVDQIIASHHRTLHDMTHRN